MVGGFEPPSPPSIDSPALNRVTTAPRRHLLICELNAYQNYRIPQRGERYDNDNLQEWRQQRHLESHIDMDVISRLQNTQKSKGINAALEKTLNENDLREEVYSETYIYIRSEEYNIISRSDCEHGMVYT